MPGPLQTIDLFALGNPTRGTLRDIRLVGDRLEFNAYHLDRHGPVNVRLYRLTPSN